FWPPIVIKVWSEVRSYWKTTHEANRLCLLLTAKGTIMVKLRNEVADQDKWNVAAMYPDLTAWEVDFDKTKGNKEFPHWPQLQSLRGTLKQGPQQVLKALDAILSLRRHLEKLYTYAHLRNDEDITHDRHKSAY